MSNLLNSLNSFISNKVFTKLLFPIKLILSMNSLYLKQNCIIKRGNYLFDRNFDSIFYSASLFYPVG